MNSNLRTLSPLNLDQLRADFPILKAKVYKKPLVYLDNAATTQKPKAVIDTLNHYYSEENANIHRGVHYLSECATDLFESARNDIKNFIGAAKSSEIIFVRGATEAINLVATSFGRKKIGKGDEIILSILEHHSNIVPWQMLCEEVGASLRVIPMNETSELILEEYERLFNDKTKLVAITHVSNALGTVNPIEKMIQMAHRCGVPVLIDGAQAVPHIPVDVQKLDCDFYVFSGHKLYGPTGIGVLYGKESHLLEMCPYQGGGDMIRSVSFEKTTYNTLPYKFEAGTPHIAGAIGLAAAIRYLKKVGIESIGAHEEELLNYAVQLLSQEKRIHIYSSAQNKVGVVSFTIDGIHPHDVGTILDREGVAIRAGHHCTMPLMERLGVDATCRASFALYNMKEEVNLLMEGIKKVIQVMG